MHSIESLNYALFIDIGASNHADLNFCKTVNGTQIYPIMAAAAKGSEEMLRLLLLNKTLSIEVENEQGVNSFWIACFYGHGHIMKILADHGINIFSKNKKDVNVMHLACEKNYVKIVEMLLDSGFSLTAETKTGMTAL
jgi:ankyrin